MDINSHLRDQAVMPTTYSIVLEVCRENQQRTGILDFGLSRRSGELIQKGLAIARR
jgi:hypothetical protein